MPDFYDKRSLRQALRDLFHEAAAAFEVLAERQYTAPWNQSAKARRCCAE